MNRNTLVVITVGAVVAVGAIVYLSRGVQTPKIEQTQGAIVLKNPKVPGSFCVQPVANNSQKTVEMDGVSESLVQELKAAGMEAGLTAAMGGGCDATIYTEIVEMGRKSATVEFRVAAKDNLVPVISATVKGKGDTREKAAAFTNSFAPKQPKAKDRDAVERAALVSAFSEQARHIVDSRDKLAAK